MLATLGVTKSIVVIVAKLMTIYVKTPDGKKLTFTKVKSTDSLGSLRKQVEKKTGIPTRLTTLYDRKRRVLKFDYKALGLYRVKDKDTLRLTAKIKIMINKKKVTLKSTQTVGKLRRLIRQITKIPIKEQVATVAKKPLGEEPQTPEAHMPIHMPAHMSVRMPTHMSTHR